MSSPSLKKIREKRMKAFTMHGSGRTPVRPSDDNNPKPSGLRGKNYVHFKLPSLKNIIQ